MLETSEDLHYNTRTMKALFGEQADLYGTYNRWELQG